MDLNVPKPDVVRRDVKSEACSHSVISQHRVSYFAKSKSRRRNGRGVDDRGKKGKTDQSQDKV